MKVVSKSSRSRRRRTDLAGMVMVHVESSSAMGGFEVTFAGFSGSISMLMRCTMLLFRLRCPFHRNQGVGAKSGRDGGFGKSGMSVDS